MEEVNKENNTNIEIPKLKNVKNYLLNKIIFAFYNFPSQTHIPI